MTLVIHIGVPKSGTTFLQTQVFDRVDGLRCIGRPHGSNEQYRLFYRALMHEENEDRAEFAINAFFAKLGPMAGSAPMILSDEAFSFAPLWHVVAKRLARAVPDAKILVTARSQFTAVKSFYSNHGRLLRGVPDPYRGRHVSFDSWLRFAHKNIDVHYQKNYLRVLFYHRLVDVFSNYFSPKQVHVLLYEQMTNEPRHFAAELSSILGIDCSSALERPGPMRMNPRSSQRNLAYNALRSRLPSVEKALYHIPGAKRMRCRIRTFLESGKPIEPELSAEQNELIQSTFAESNQRLAATFDLPLALYGYPLPTQTLSADLRRAEHQV